VTVARPVREKPSQPFTPLFLHDPSVARGDISDRRVDTRVYIALSREIRWPARTGSETLNHGTPASASVGQPRLREGRGGVGDLLG
jgi:hypothetical protein